MLRSERISFQKINKSLSIVLLLSLNPREKFVKTLPLT